MWLLGIEARSSPRAASALTHKLYLSLALGEVLTGTKSGASVVSKCCLPHPDNMTIHSHTHAQVDAGCSLVAHWGCQQGLLLLVVVSHSVLAVFQE